MFAQIRLSNKKNINLELYPEVAPISVENFVKLAKDGYYKGTIFHRIIEDFMIQGGGYIVRDNTLMEAPELTPIKGEFRSNGVENNIVHELGVISMARTSIKDSATSQFFICSANTPWLDGEYAAFGKTTDEESNKIVIEISKMPHLCIRGLMTVAPYTENAEKNRIYFRKMKQLLIDISSKNIDNVSMDTLSMGMSSDYEVAIEEGATIVRVGTGIFGERVYP